VKDAPSLLETKVPYSEKGAAAARQWLKGRLQGRIPASILDDLLVCASELVTNSYHHTKPYNDGDKIMLFLQLGERCVRVDVFDNGSIMAPVMHNADPANIRGRGLWLVDQLSHDWGSYSSKNGGAVWFEFRTLVTDRAEPGPAVDAPEQPKMRLA
jgi:anti-sigma regulatory factor (Ser/Thr protein kinase)